VKDIGFEEYKLRVESQKKENYKYKEGRSQDEK
jgi:hypothetical protein